MIVRGERHTSKKHPSPGEMGVVDGLYNVKKLVRKSTSEPRKASHMHESQNGQQEGASQQDNLFWFFMKVRGNSAQKQRPNDGVYRETEAYSHERVRGLDCVCATM